jgi:hypothetical protein
MTSLQAAEFYIDRGLHPIPIPPREKAPQIDGWPSLESCRSCRAGPALARREGRTESGLHRAGWSLARGGWAVGQAVAFHRSLYCALWGSRVNLEAWLIESANGAFLSWTWLDYLAKNADRKVDGSRPGGRNE